MKKLIFVLCLLPNLCFGASINFGIYTDHFMTNEYVEYVEDNDLLVIEHNGYFAASFTNSFGQQTYALGREFMVTDNLGFIGGISHGYDSRCSGLMQKDCPMPMEMKQDFNLLVSGYAKYTINNVRLSVIVNPVYSTILMGYEF